MRRRPSCAPKRNRCRRNWTKSTGASCSSKSNARRSSAKPTRPPRTAWDAWKKSWPRSANVTTRWKRNGARRRRAWRALAKIKAEIEQTKQEIEKARREYDLNRLAELQYGKLAGLEKQLAEEEEALLKKAGGERLIKEEVDEEDIAEVVARWTGVPVSRLMEGEVEKLTHLEDELA